MSKKLVALSLLAVFLVGFIAGYNILLEGHRAPKVNANVYVLHESMNGKEVIPTGNVITNIAEIALRNLLAFDNDTGLDGANVTDYISLGNSTVAATLTKITTECDNSSAFGRAQGTVTSWYNGTDYAYNVTKTFMANATVTIDTAGLNWFWSDESDGNLFAVAAITQTAFAASDNCTITWVITIDAN